MVVKPFPNPGHGLLASNPGELVFEIRESRCDDVAMMNLGADDLYRLQPQPVNPLDISGRQIRRVRPEREMIDFPVEPGGRL